MAALVVPDTQGARSYRVHVPPGADGPLPMVVVLHGCSQDAAAIATGTRMNELADSEGFLVVYPEQTSAANRSGCWNWFLPEHQRRDAGEPALIAGIARDVLAGAAGVTPDPRRVYLAGMSAGAAMASLVAAEYPELIAALGLHSGVVYRAASTVSDAFAVLRRGISDVEGSARKAYAGMADRARVMPAVIFHGTEDRTVSVVNGDQSVRQWLATDVLAAGGSLRADPDRPTRVRQGRAPGGRSFTVRSWDDVTGRVVVEYWRIDGMGHGWSGGSSAGSFTDRAGPDATAAMWQFFCTSARG